MDEAKPSGSRKVLVILGLAILAALLLGAVAAYSFMKEYFEHAKVVDALENAVQTHNSLKAASISKTLNETREKWETIPFAKAHTVEVLNAAENEFKGDDSRWEIAVHASDYFGYLQSFPNGLHKAEAEEEIFYSKIAGNLTPENIQEYAASYPAGKHIDALKGGYEGGMFSRAKEKKSIPDLEAYLAAFPSGKYATEVRDLIQRCSAKIFTVQLFGEVDFKDLQGLQAKLRELDFTPDSVAGGKFTTSYQFAIYSGTKTGQVYEYGNTGLLGTGTPVATRKAEKVAIVAVLSERATKKVIWAGAGVGEEIPPEKVTIFTQGGKAEEPMPTQETIHWGAVHKVSSSLYDHFALAWQAEFVKNWPQVKAEEGIQKALADYPELQRAAQ